MDDTNKQTDRKKSSEKGNSRRVVDMSWAAKYLDDDWENKHSADGACDTRVAKPVGDRKAAEDDESGESQNNTPDASYTQRFRPVNVEEEAEAAEAAEAAEEKDIGISDAVTEETIASIEEDRQEGDQETGSVRIRDAVTGQTVANVEKTKAVRSVVFQMGLDEDLDELSKLRDARGNRLAKAAANTGEKLSEQKQSTQQEQSAQQKQSADPTATIKLPAFTVKRAATKEKTEKEKTEKEKTAKEKTAKEKSAKEKTAKEKTTTKDAETATKTKTLTAATIVASKESASVRKAASETIDLEDIINDEEPVDVNKARDTQEKKKATERKRTVEKKRQLEKRRTRQRIADPEDDYAEEDYYEEDLHKSRRYRSDNYDDRYQYEYMPSKSPLRFIPLVLVIALCVFGFIAAREICHDVPLNSSDYSKVKYTVTAGLTDEQLAQDLESLGLIDNQLIFRIRCVFYSADYVEGTYELSPCYSTEKIINILSGYTYGGDD